MRGVLFAAAVAIWVALAWHAFTMDDPWTCSDDDCTETHP